MTFDRQARHRARKALCQALYQWHMNPSEVALLRDQFTDNPVYARMDQGYFVELLEGVLAEVEALDAAIAPRIDRPFEQLTATELAILRLGAYELTYRLELPFKVVIKEAIFLAEAYGATDASKFINGVLDALAKELRAGEA